ncbi:hypothetical protein [Mycobacterium hubeiense]|uniref:hypothetical protein n=1 Tax=Mycobacterium hubeiense TaxID=1867256 RepID=UPI001E293B5D|nr:hypothetical protein [Mycobacterium sp. QGD 101]
MRHSLRLGTALLLLLMAVACSQNGDPVGRTTNARIETSTSPELIKEATAFGGLVLPPGAEVLQARVDSALDTRYQLALRIDPDGLTKLLADSHFDKPLIKAYPPFEEVIAGPSLATSPLVLTAQDRYQNAEGMSVYRTVIVDERDPSTWIVHLSMNTT